MFCGGSLPSASNLQLGQVALLFTAGLRTLSPPLTELHPAVALRSTTKQHACHLHEGGGVYIWLMVPIIVVEGGAGAPLMNVPRDSGDSGGGDECGGGAAATAVREAARAEFERATALAGLCVCVRACVREVTSCHTAGSSALVRHICRRARGPCLRVRGQRARRPQQCTQITYPIQSIN